MFSNTVFEQMRPSNTKMYKCGKVVRQSYLARAAQSDKWKLDNILWKDSFDLFIMFLIIVSDIVKLLSN